MALFSSSSPFQMDNVHTSEFYTNASSKYFSRASILVSIEPSQTSNCREATRRKQSEEKSGGEETAVCQTSQFCPTHSIVVLCSRQQIKQRMTTSKQSTKSTTTNQGSRSSSLALFHSPSNKFATLMLLLTFLASSLLMSGTQATIIPMGGLGGGESESEQQEGSSNGIKRAEELVRWAQFLKFPKYGQPQQQPQEFLVLEQVPADSDQPQQFVLPVHGKIPSKRGDEKRRDFEHGWEQCEFSPISCMLKRRRRR